jgi:hypothetical protein
MFDHGDQTIKELSKSTGYSASFLRIQLELMGPELKIDKRRQPYTYDVADESPERVMRKAIESAKAQLLASEQSKNVFIQSVRTRPKEKWIDNVINLRAIAQAIEELEAEGQLIDTL